MLVMDARAYTPLSDVRAATRQISAGVGNSSGSALHQTLVACRLDQDVSGRSPVPMHQQQQNQENPIDLPILILFVSAKGVAGGGTINTMVPASLRRLPSQVAAPEWTRPPRKSRKAPNPSPLIEIITFKWGTQGPKGCKVVRLAKAAASGHRPPCHVFGLRLGTDIRARDLVWSVEQQQDHVGRHKWPPFGSCCRSSCFHWCQGTSTTFCICTADSRCASPRVIVTSAVYSRLVEFLIHFDLRNS
jgi:hypothetical protein